MAFMTLFEDRLGGVARSPRILKGRGRRLVNFTELCSLSRVAIAMKVGVASRRAPGEQGIALGGGKGDAIAQLGLVSCRTRGVIHRKSENPFEHDFTHIDNKVDVGD